MLARASYGLKPVVSGRCRLTAGLIVVLAQGAVSSDRDAQPVAAAAASSACVPTIDTLHDSIYVVLAASPRHPGLAPSELLPALRGIAWRAHISGIGRISLAGLPGPGMLDLRTGQAAHTLPPEFATVPGEYAFTLHRNASVSHVRVITAARVRHLDTAITVGFARIDTAPAERLSAPQREPAPLFPASVAEDSLPLRIRFSIGPDTTGANALFAVREIALMHIDRQAVPSADNPRPVYPAGHRSKTDTVLVQFGVTADGRVDMTSVEPVRAWAQPFVDAVVTILPRLRYTPALAGDVRSGPCCCNPSSCDPAAPSVESPHSHSLARWTRLGGHTTFVSRGARGGVHFATRNLPTNAHRSGRCRRVPRNAPSWKHRASRSRATVWLRPDTTESSVNGHHSRAIPWSIAVPRSDMS